MPASEASKRATAKYNLKAYDRLEIKVKKGYKREICDIAESLGDSMNGYVKKAIKAQILRDTGKDADL